MITKYKATPNSYKKEGDCLIRSDGCRIYAGQEIIDGVAGKPVKSRVIEIKTKKDSAVVHIILEREEHLQKGGVRIRTKKVNPGYVFGRLDKEEGRNIT
jgi:hypothetical protein